MQENYHEKPFLLPFLQNFSNPTNHLLVRKCFKNRFCVKIHICILILRYDKCYLFSSNLFFSTPNVFVIRVFLLCFCVCQIPPHTTRTHIDSSFSFERQYLFLKLLVFYQYFILHPAPQKKKNIKKIEVNFYMCFVRVLYEIRYL